jgi:hypothetical protein
MFCSVLMKNVRSEFESSMANYVCVCAYVHVYDSGRSCCRSCVRVLGGCGSFTALCAGDISTRYCIVLYSVAFCSPSLSHAALRV